MCPVVTLCGSTRFKDAFMLAQRELTLQGVIVLSVGVFGHADGAPDGVKGMLDDLHKRKIDLSDAIFVVNPGGYVGESTRDEVAYARSHAKPVFYLEEGRDSYGRRVEIG